MSTHIVIGGPSNAGKSTLTASLYTQLLNLGMSVGIHEVDVYSDTIPCILGQKPWEKRRKRKQVRFRTVEKRVQEFASDLRDIVLGDLPGRIDGRYLDDMVVPADCAIVVAKDWGTLDEWEEFFVKKSIPIILRVVSHLGQLPLIPPTRDVLHVKGLKRQIHLNGEVSHVAKHLTRFCTQSVAL